MAEIYDTLATAIGNPKHVHCAKCGRVEHIVAAECLRSGWPICCGYTMRLGVPRGG